MIIWNVSPLRFAGIPHDWIQVMHLWPENYTKDDVSFSDIPGIGYLSAPPILDINSDYLIPFLPKLDDSCPNPSLL